MSAAPAAEWDAVSVRFEGSERAAVGPVSLRVRRGERVLLLGPSGCGKSTLLLALTGLIPSAVPGEVSGSRRLFGEDAGSRAPADWADRVAHLFQAPERNLVGMRVDEEVAFALEQRGLREDRIRARVARAMAEAALPPDMARRRVATLSGGEKQKVALAAALAQGAELLLVDEPTAHLDPAAAAQVHALLAAPDQRRAVLVVDHRLEGLIEAIDRVVVLGADGRLTAEGPPRRLFRRERARLEAMGVWTPAASALDAALIEAGVTLPVPPLGVAEALDGLDAAPPALRERAPPAVRRLCEAERRRGPVRRGPDRRNPVRRGPVVARLRDVDCRTPGGPVALRGASLDVRGGEVLAIVGPNGAGKSTLALALAGLIPPAAGAREGPPGGLVLQNPDLQFVAGSVEEEIAASLPPRERRSGRAAAILGEWGLAPLARRHPLELSEGQKRRLALAAVDAVADWPLLVLDEPTAGLDLAAAWRLEHRVARIAERDRAVALVTHDMDLVARLADRVALVAEGRLVRVDAAEAVLSDAALLRAHRLAAPALTPARAWLRRTGALSC